MAETSMNPYYKYTVNGPYLREDGRKHVCLVHTVTRKKLTVSYPKYKVELKIGRLLKDNEEIHHKDGDFRNNEWSNLEIKNCTLHRREHNIKYKENIEVECFQCKKIFIVTPLKQRRKRQNIKRKNKNYFCSKRCIGIYGTIIQYSRCGEIGDTQRT